MRNQGVTSDFPTAGRGLESENADRDSSPIGVNHNSNGRAGGPLPLYPTGVSGAIATVPKNRVEEVRIRIETYHGHDCVDVRAFADFDQTGEMRPTKKGVALRLALLPELIAGLQLAEAEARRRGLLDGAAA